MRKTRTSMCTNATFHLPTHLAKVAVDSNWDAPSSPGPPPPGQAALASSLNAVESKGISSAPACLSLSTAELMASEICMHAGSTRTCLSTKI